MIGPVKVPGEIDKRSKELTHISDAVGYDLAKVRAPAKGAQH